MWIGLCYHIQQNDGSASQHRNKKNICRVAAVLLCHCRFVYSVGGMLVSECPQDVVHSTHPFRIEQKNRTMSGNVRCPTTSTTQQEEKENNNSNSKTLVWQYQTQNHGLVGNSQIQTHHPDSAGRPRRRRRHGIPQTPGRDTPTRLGHGCIVETLSSGIPTHENRHRHW